MKIVGLYIYVQLLFGVLIKHFNCSLERTLVLGVTVLYYVIKQFNWSVSMCISVGLLIIGFVVV